LALVTHLNIRNNEVTNASLDNAAIFTVSGLTADAISIGQDQGNPARGCFDMSGSNSVSAFFHSSSAGGDSTVVIKNVNAEYHLSTSGINGDSFVIRETVGEAILLCAASGGDICIPGDLVTGGSITMGSGPITATNVCATQCLCVLGCSNLQNDVFIANGAGLLIGGVTQQTTGVISEVQILGTGAPDSEMLMGAWSSGGVAPQLRMLASNNDTIGSNTIVTDGRQLGEIRWYGDDGVDYASLAAAIRVDVDGTPGAGDMPGRILLMTTADGAQAPTERMRIDSAGNVGIGVTPTATHADYTELRLGGNGTIDWKTAAGASNQVNILQNATLGTDGNFDYISTDEATRYLQADGMHQFYSAASGTAGNNITFTERMRIDASGNVGIGTTPETKLHVYSGSSGATANASADEIFVENSAAAGITIGTPNNDNGYLAFADPEDSWPGRINYEHTANAMKFYAGGSEVFRAHSGNVGIGITCGSCAPSSKLFVDNASTAQTAAFIRTAAANTALYVVHTGTATGIPFEFESTGDNSATTAMARFRQNNAASTNPAFQVVNDGTGSTISLCAACPTQLINSSAGRSVIYTGGDADKCIVIGAGSCIGGGPGAAIVLCNFGAQACGQTSFWVTKGGTGVREAMRISTTGDVCFYCNQNTVGTICSAVDFVGPAKSFLIRHPLANKEKPNKYNSMTLTHAVSEGPEHGVYQRGTAKLCCGIAIVELPHYYAALTHPDLNTIQLTPVFGWSPLVIKCRVKDNQFVVCTTKDGNKKQEFDWRVEGRRNDDHIRNVLSEGNKPKTRPDGSLIVEQWESDVEQLVKKDELEVLTKDELKSIAKHNLVDFKDSDSKSKLVEEVIKK